MIRFLGDLRLLPVVLFAAGCLFALKMIGLVSAGGYTLGAGYLAKSDYAAKLAGKTAQVQSLPATESRQSWAQEMFNFPDVTGSVGAAKPPEKNADKAKTPEKTPEKPDKSPDKAGEKPAAKDKPADAKADDKKPGVSTTPPVDVTQQMSPAERALLTRLNQRRQELDSRAREIELRETLLKASEKKLENRLNELKQQEARVKDAMKMKEESESARFKGLVTMYESMKAKDAAKIFDRLDIKVLMDVASQINPRRMSDIMGQMSPEAAERLTIEMASRAGANEKTSPAAQAQPELPKIEGRPKGT